MPDQIAIARGSRTKRKRIASKRTSVCASMPLRKRRFGEQRELHVVAHDQPPEHRARVTADAARVFGDNARIDGEA